MLLSFRSQIKVLKYYLSTSNKNPYDVLGIKRKASIDQIKKAFRAIAQKNHPDKNPDSKAQELFVEAKHAYETLSDEDKRRQYDNETAGRSGGSRSYGFDKDPFEQFNQDIYKDKSRVYHDTYTTGSTRRKRGEDITRQVKVEFLEAVKGSTVNLQFQRKDTCETCNGNRCQAGTAPSRCLACGGSGSTIYRQSSIVMHLQCTRCKGIGLIIKNPCTECKATGIKISKVNEIIDIPSGIQTGQTITLRQKGNQSENGPGGDLHIKLHVQKHPKFRKNGYNIESTEWITISQAALGFNKKVQTIWGFKDIQIPSGTQDGKKLIISSEGIRKNIEIGDHICVIRIKIPKQLTSRQKQIFQQLAKEETKVKENDKECEQDVAQEQRKPFQKFKDYFK